MYLNIFFSFQLFCLTWIWLEISGWEDCGGGCCCLTTFKSCNFWLHCSQSFVLIILFDGRKESYSGLVASVCTTHRKLHKNLSVEANLREFVMQTKHFSTKILRNSIFSYWYLDQVWTNFVKSFWGLTKHLIKASTPITMFLMGKVLLSSGCSWHIFFFLLIKWLWLRYCGKYQS